MTRREWLGRLPANSLMTAAIGLIGESPLAAQSTASNPAGRTGIYNVRDFGAKGDGTTLDTPALQSAIDACTRDGGGTVLVPAGTFVIGATELKSNVTLHIANGATLLGSGDGKQYHAVDAIPLSGDTTLVDGNWALLFAVNAKNVTIEGPGTIDGQGALFHSKVRGEKPPSGLSGSHRPYHVLTYRCENLSIRNLDLINCAYHSIRIIQTKRVHLDGIYIHSRVNGNNDGFHFISSQFVTISNCVVLSQDDACALFGSCQFFTITNSLFSTRWSVFRFGGGYAQNITVSNCLLHQVYGCPIKFQGNPGSQYENISFSNLMLDDVTGPIHVGVGPRAPRKGPANTPVNDDMNPGAKDPNSTPAILRNVSFANIKGNVTTRPGQLSEAEVGSTPNPGEMRSCIVFNCTGGATMENISLSDINLTFGGGGTAEDGARRDIPEIAGEYFMLGPMPAYGFYARGVRGLSLQNVRLQTTSPDLRPAFILDNVADAYISGLTVQGNPSTESTLRITNSKQVLFTTPRLIDHASVFLQLEGSGNERITVDGGDISGATTPVAFKTGATKAAIKIRQ